MKIAALFTGQGSQKEGMGEEFYSENEVFRGVFDSCDLATSIDLKKACFEGEGLSLTSITQPALYAVNIATYKMLESMGIKADIFAGLSLGEYDALAAAGVLDVANTTELVTVRGHLMESAVPPGKASMTAVIGLPADEIEKAIDGIDNVWISNMNSPGQTIIGGTIEALDIADTKVKEAGAAIVKRLDVAGPFHTPLLDEAGEKLLTELRKYDVNTTDKIVYANYSGGPYLKSDDIRDILSKQVSSKVYWAKIMDEIIKTADIIIECGPGNVLSKLVKKQAKAMGRDVSVFKASSMNDIESIKEAVLG